MNLFIVCYHSEPARYLRPGENNQFQLVERAIAAGEWPYDNGDDPSFYVYRNQQLPLTWGVCRENVRTPLVCGDIVAFIAYSRTGVGSFHYRFSAVATVSHKLDHRNVASDVELRTGRYVNCLVQGSDSGSGWRWAEDDRPPSARHKDWLWRIARHNRLRKSKFPKGLMSFEEHAEIDGKPVTASSNYVVFSNDSEQTFVSTSAPHVATSKGTGYQEGWQDRDFFSEIFVFEGGRAPRTYVRSTNAYGAAHPPIHWSVPDSIGLKWRANLMRLLRNADGD